MPSNLVSRSAPGSCLTLVPPPPVHCTSCTLYTTEVIARNLSYPSSGDWRAMHPRYVTSGQFSSSVEFLMTYKSAFYACIMQNIFYCLIPPI